MCHLVYLEQCFGFLQCKKKVAIIRLRHSKSYISKSWQLVRYQLLSCDLCLCASSLYMCMWVVYMSDLVWEHLVQSVGPVMLVQIFMSAFEKVQ